MHWFVAVQATLDTEEVHVNILRQLALSAAHRQSLTSHYKMGHRQAKLQQPFRQKLMFKKNISLLH